MSISAQSKIRGGGDSGKVARLMPSEIRGEQDFAAGGIQFQNEAAGPVRHLGRDDRVHQGKVVGIGTSYDPEVALGIDNRIRRNIVSAAANGCKGRQPE